MEKFERHIPATRLRRVGAAFVNAMCLGLLVLIYESSTGREASDALFYLLCVLFIAVTIFIPESPGKRFCNLSVLGVEKEKIEKRTRLIRASPYFLLALSSCLAVTIENPAKVYILGPIRGLSYLFIIVNGLSIFFSRYGLSMMDRILKTQVMSPPPLHESLKPTIGGLKIR